VVRFYPVDIGLTKMGGITPRIFVENGTLKASAWEIERVQRRGAVPVTGNPLGPRQPYRTESYHQCWLCPYRCGAVKETICFPPTELKKENRRPGKITSFQGAGLRFYNLLWAMGRTRARLAALTPSLL